MPLDGVQMQPRDVAALAYAAGWKDARRLMEAVQVCMAESRGWTNAFNENIRDGQVVSKDVGLYQISIPASAIGTSRETDLYEPEFNVGVARKMYVDRAWQPWVAWNTNVCFRDTYIKLAARGVGNFLAELALAHTPTDTLNEGQPYVHKLTDPVLNYSYRVAGMKQALDAILARARQLKPIGGPLVDAKADEIIGLAVEGAAWPKK